jgi:hypothetical protein
MFRSVGRAKTVNMNALLVICSQCWVVCNVSLYKLKIKIGKDLCMKAYGIVEISRAQAQLEETR